MPRLVPEVRGARWVGSIRVVRSIVATESPAANTAVVASVGVAARANQTEGEMAGHARDCTGRALGLLRRALQAPHLPHPQGNLPYRRLRLRPRRVRRRPDGHQVPHLRRRRAGHELLDPRGRRRACRVQDGDGRPIPGCELHKSSEIFGDAIEQIVSWGENTNVGALEGTPVRLRFVMQDSDLSSIRFRTATSA